MKIKQSLCNLDYVFVLDSTYQMKDLALVTFFKDRNNTRNIVQSELKKLLQVNHSFQKILKLISRKKKVKTSSKKDFFNFNLQIIQWKS